MRMHLCASIQEKHSLKPIFYQKLCARCNNLDMRKDGGGLHRMWYLLTASRQDQYHDVHKETQTKNLQHDESDVSKHASLNDLFGSNDLFWQ